MPNYIKKMIPSAVILVLDLIVILLIPSQVNVLIDGTVTTRFMPYVVSILIAGCAVADLLQVYFKNRHTEDGKAKKAYFDKRGFLRVLGCVAAVAVYLLLMKTLGFVVATILLCAVTMLLMGARKWLTIVLVSVILTMVVYCIFKLGLNLRLPTGLFFF